MFNYYQPFIAPFLRKERYQLPPGIRQLYYVSMEDAFWDILPKKRLKPGAVILVPDFYCIDVAENIEAHGYRVVLYPVTAHFQVAEQALLKLVKQHHPAAIILLHACGIRLSAFSAEIYRQIQEISPGCLCMEDNVHRLLDPTTVHCYGPNHLLFDSLRKVSPLPGSFTYGLRSALPFSEPQTHNWHWYRWLALVYFLTFRCVYVLSELLSWPWLCLVAHEKVLKKHDDLIGDLNVPPAGFWIFRRLHQHFDFAKVRARKRAQVQEYERLLDLALSQADAKLPVYRVAIPEADFGELHVYPIGLKLAAESASVQRLLRELHKQGIIIWVKFPDSPWSKRQSVLFMPLGFHVTEADQARAMSVIFAKLAESL